MKAILLTLTILLVQACTISTRAQSNAPTSFSTDFSDPGNSGNWVSLDLDDTKDEFIFDVINGEMHLIIDKTSWHYAQLWIKPFNLKQSPYISFDIKTNEPIEITIGVKTDGVWEITSDFTTGGTGAYEHIFMDFSDQASAMTADMEEFQFMVPYGNFTGELWLDNFKMGDAATPPLIPEGTGFTVDFEGTWPDTTWKSGQQYSLNQAGGNLQIDVQKFEPGITFQYKYEGVYNISGNPYVNVLAKADRPLVLWVRIWEGSRSVERKVRVYETGGFTNYCFDFSDSGNVFLGEVRMIEFGVNEPATGFDGIVWMDDLKFGSDAAKFASLGGMKDQLCYLASKGNSLLLTDVENIASLTTSGAESLIENIRFTPAGNGAFMMKFDCIDDASGTATVTVTANGADGWGDHSVSFEIAIVGNAPPLVDQVENMEVKAGEEYSFTVSGIGDGDVAVEQSIEIMASSSNADVLDTAYIMYESGPYASVLFTPSDSGLTTVSIILNDGEPVNNLGSMNFDVRSYLDLNSLPAIEPLKDLVIAPDAGEQVITLTGITDGDEGIQTLALAAVSSADTIVPTPFVEYSGGETALLRFTPNPAYTGISTISVTVTDDGGSEINNGNLATEISFRVETLYPNKKGYVVPLTESDRGMWGFEKEGEVYNVTFDDSGEFETMEIVMSGKSTWDGMWLTLPEELDLSEDPYISYEVYSAGQPTYHWNYFFDNNSERNIKNSREHMFEAPASQWTLISYDYSDPGDMQTNEATEINAERINAVLFNLHDSPGSWPFTAIDGTVRYRNIRVGDSAIVTEKIPVATIHGVPDQVQYSGVGEQSITLSGISDGMGGKASVTASSRKTEIVPDPIVSEVVDGRATLTYTIGSQTGSSKITLTVSADGSEEKRITFDVFVNEEEISQSATVTIDPSQTFQEIEGLGVHWLNAGDVEMFVNDLGGSVLRYWQVSNILEPVNDNDDPYVLNRDALEYSALDVDLINRLTDAGMERFIFTIFTPPAWMKRNLSTNATAGAPQYANTDNILEPYYFEEFAEHMVAWITLFKEECGVDLYAVGLQNEPAFNEPYASAIYSPEKFAELIAVVGKRFESEGINTKIFATEALFYPNQYSFEQYVDAINKNPEADKYTDIIATHHFSKNGKAGSPTRENEWNNLWGHINQGTRERAFWQTEESVFGGSGTDPLADALYLGGMYRDAFQFGDMAMNIWLTFYTPGATADAGLLQGQDTSYLYQVHKHFYKYVRPGALRVESYSDHPDLLPLAFEHRENGTHTVILINQSDKAISFDLAGSNIPEKFTAYTTASSVKFKEMDPVEDNLYLLPPNSITTLIAGENSPLTIDQVANQVIPINSPEQMINLSGISDGLDGTAGFTISAVSSNPALLGNPTVTDVLADGTSSLVYTPASGRSGSAKVTVTIENGGFSRSTSFYVTVEVIEGTSDRTTDRLRIYPNPADDVLYIAIPESGFTDLIVADLNGRTILNKKLDQGRHTGTIDLASFEAGIYILSIRKEERVLRSRFLVK